MLRPYRNIDIVIKGIIRMKKAALYQRLFS
jgi:hypothetical protein